jgi:hypothetical protein
LQRVTRAKEKMLRHEIHRENGFSSCLKAPKALNPVRRRRWRIIIQKMMYKRHLKVHKNIIYSNLMQSASEPALDGVRQEYLRSMMHMVNFLSVKITPFMDSDKKRGFKVTVKIQTQQQEMKSR